MMIDLIKVVILFTIFTFYSCEINQTYHYKYSGMFGDEYYTVQPKEEGISYFFQEYTYNLDSNFSNNHNTYSRLIKGEQNNNTIKYNSYVFNLNKDINDCWTFEKGDSFKQSYDICVHDIIEDTTVNNLFIEKLIVYKVSPSDSYSVDIPNEKILFDEKRRLIIFCIGFINNRIEYSYQLINY